MDSPDNRHLVILGATGLGKTQTALSIAEWAAGHLAGHLAAAYPGARARAAVAPATT